MTLAVEAVLRTWKFISCFIYFRVWLKIDIIVSKCKNRFTEVWLSYKVVIISLVQQVSQSLIHTHPSSWGGIYPFLKKAWEEREWGCDFYMGKSRSLAVVLPLNLCLSDLVPVSSVLAAPPLFKGSKRWRSCPLFLSRAVALTVTWDGLRGAVSPALCSLPEGSTSRTVIMKGWTLLMWTGLWWTLVRKAFFWLPGYVCKQFILECVQGGFILQGQTFYRGFTCVCVYIFNGQARYCVTSNSISVQASDLELWLSWLLTHLWVRLGES